VNRITASPPQAPADQTPSAGELQSPVAPGGVSPERPTDSPGVPDYDLLRRVGSGAYGEVWLARSKATGAFRAAKIVWRHKFEDDRPFRREFDGIQKFERISRDHPSQLGLFHIGRNDAEGYFYYVMELADDGTTGLQDGTQEPATYTPHTLRADLANGRLAPARALEIGMALAEALSHLHQHGLVHRDVKPSNVIFVNGRPKLADIGLVTDVSDQCSIVGTEGYLPPEGPGTPQADIFALGKVLYEAATGMDRRSFPDLPADIRVWPEAGPILELNQVVLRACAVELRARYQCADEMRGELLHLQESKSLVRMRRHQRQRGLLLRGMAWVGAAGAALCLLALADRVLWSRGVLRPGQGGSQTPAHSFYTLGRSNLDQFLTAPDLQLAADDFSRSIQAEPGFAPAYGCLAYTYTLWMSDGWNPAWKDLPKAQEYALKGLERGDTAEAHLALGWYKAMAEWRWRDAQIEYDRALELQPASALCHLSYAEYLRVIGHAEKALKELKTAMSIEPHPKFLDGRRFPAFLVDARQFEEALAAIEKARGSVPAAWSINNERSALCGLGRFADAIEVDRKFLVSRGELDDKMEQEFIRLRQALEHQGGAGYWRTAIKMTRGFERICYYAKAAEKEKALTLLRAAVVQRDRPAIFHVMADWRLDDLRSAPEFQELLREMNLSKVALEDRPWPPQPSK
jgi:serine/threonine protein kinase